MGTSDFTPFWGLFYLVMGKENTFYFTHDYNARSDSKIKRLLSKHGCMGYGLYWAIIEDLYNNANVMQLDYESIAYDLRTEESVVKSVINDFDLFVIYDDFFGSNSVQRRLDERDSKSKKASESAQERWRRNADALRAQSDSNAIKERKVKESKGKESKVKENKDEERAHPKNKKNKNPELQEVLDYFKENGFSEAAAKKAFDYYESGNWHDSKGNQVKNWKQKMQGVWFKDENKIQKPNETPKINPVFDLGMKYSGPMNTFMGRCEGYRINNPGQEPPQEWFDKFNKENGTDLQPRKILETA
mgnify:FL=1